MGCFCCMHWVIVHLYYEAPPNQLAPFGWIWVESILLYNSELFWLLLSSVTSSLTPVTQPMEAMHAASRFTDDVVRFGSWSSPYFFLFPSFWYRLILISAVQRMLLQKWSGFFRYCHGSWVCVLIPLCVLCVLCGCLLLLATSIPNQVLSPASCCQYWVSYKKSNPLQITNYFFKIAIWLHYWLLHLKSNQITNY